MVCCQATSLAGIFGWEEDSCIPQLSERQRLYSMAGCGGWLSSLWGVAKGDALCWARPRAVLPAQARPQTISAIWQGCTLGPVVSSVTGWILKLSRVTVQAPGYEGPEAVLHILTVLLTWLPAQVWPQDGLCSCPDSLGGLPAQQDWRLYIWMGLQIYFPARQGHTIGSTVSTSFCWRTKSLSPLVKLSPIQI